MDLVDGIDHVQPALRVLDVTQDHIQKLSRKLPTVAAQAQRVVDEVLEELGNHPGRDQAQGSSKKDEEVESLCELPPVSKERP